MIVGGGCQPWGVVRVDVLVGVSYCERLGRTDARGGRVQTGFGLRVAVSGWHPLLVWGQAADRLMAARQVARLVRPPVVDGEQVDETPFRVVDPDSTFSEIIVRMGLADGGVLFVDRVDEFSVSMIDRVRVVWEPSKVLLVAGAVTPVVEAGWVSDVFTVRLRAKDVIAASGGVGGPFELVAGSHRLGVSPEAREMLPGSGRGRGMVLRVARTVACLEGAGRVDVEHVRRVLGLRWG